MSVNQNENHGVCMHDLQGCKRGYDGNITSSHGDTSAMRFGSYKTRGNLTRHLETHNELHSHSCPVDGCDRSLTGQGAWFYRKDHVVEHLKAVQGLDREAAKFVMNSRGAINPFLQRNEFDDLLAADPALGDNHDEQANQEEGAND